MESSVPQTPCSRIISSRHLKKNNNFAFIERLDQSHLYPVWMALEKSHPDSLLLAIRNIYKNLHMIPRHFKRCVQWDRKWIEKWASVEGLYCKRPIQCLASSEILTPPLTARRVCTPPPPFGAGGGHTRWVERGWGINSSQYARHCSVLYICKYFVVASVRHWSRTSTIEFLLVFNFLPSSLLCNCAVPIQDCNIHILFI